MDKGRVRTNVQHDNTVPEAQDGKGDENVRLVLRGESRAEFEWGFRSPVASCEFAADVAGSQCLAENAPCFLEGTKSFSECD